MKKIKLLITIVAMLATTLFSCKKTTTTGYVGKPPVAKFDWDSVDLWKFNGQIDFSNFLASAEKYEWNYGDGKTEQSSTGLNFHSHTYSASGTYDVTLTSSNSYGSNSITKKVVVPKFKGFATFYTYTYLTLANPIKVTLENAESGKFIEYVTSDAYAWIGDCDYHNGTAQFEVPAGIYNVTIEASWLTTKYQTLEIKADGNCNVQKL
jgi:PKD repeat protein